MQLAHVPGISGFRLKEEKKKSKTYGPGVEGGAPIVFGSE